MIARFPCSTYQSYRIYSCYHMDCYDYKVFIRDIVVITVSRDIAVIIVSRDMSIGL